MSNIVHNETVTLSGSDQVVVPDVPFNVVDIRTDGSVDVLCWVDDPNAAATKKRKIETDFPQFAGSLPGAKLYLNGASGTVEVMLAVE